MLFKQTSLHAQAASSQQPSWKGSFARYSHALSLDVEGTGI